MFRKKVKPENIKDIGKIITTAEITIPFGYEYKQIYEEHTKELYDFINRHLENKKALVEIRWEEKTVVLRVEIDYLYETIFLLGYGLKMIDDWILEAVCNKAQDKFEHIQDITGNLNIN